MRRKLVAELRKAGSITTEEVAQAFIDVPRELFVPKTLKEGGLEAVYVNNVLSLKTDEFGSPISTSSQPGIMAQMLEALDVNPGARILEIGAGSGYNAALLESLTGSTGRVTSIELEPDLAANARRSLRIGGFKSRVVVGDGTKASRKHAPYDRIISTASTTGIPKAWFQQLKREGLLETPLRLHSGIHWPQIAVVLKAEKDKLKLIKATPAAFMQVRSRAGSPAREQETTTYVGASRRGKPITMVHLQGKEIDRLSSRKLRDAIELAALQPNRKALRNPVRRQDFEAFLCLTPQNPKLVSLVRDGFVTVAVVDPEFSSLACLGGGSRRKWNSPATRIEVSGSRKAESILRQLISEWERLGKPGLKDLRLTVSFIRPTKAWRTRKDGESFLAFDWV